MRLVDHEQVTVPGLVEEAAQIGVRREDVVEVGDDDAGQRSQRERDLVGTEAQIERALAQRLAVDDARVQKLVEQARGLEPLVETVQLRAPTLDTAQCLLRADAVARADLQREGPAAGGELLPQRLQRELLLRDLGRDEEERAVVRQGAFEHRVQGCCGLADSGRRRAEQDQAGLCDAVHVAQHHVLTGPQLGEGKAEPPSQLVPRIRPARPAATAAQRASECVVEPALPELGPERQIEPAHAPVEQGEVHQRALPHLLAGAREQQAEQTHALDLSLVPAALDRGHEAVRLDHAALASHAQAGDPALDAHREAAPLEALLQADSGAESGGIGAREVALERSLLEALAPG